MLAGLELDWHTENMNFALAPIDDEPYTGEDRQAVAEADEWRKHNEAVPLENVLADFGLSLADWETMGKSPLPEEDASER